MLPLAYQVENLHNFTSFCRAIIEVQKILKKAQFKAWKVFHTLFGLYWLHVDIWEGLPAFCALRRPRRQKDQHNNLETRKKGV